MPAPRRRPSPYPSRRPYVAGRRRPTGGKPSPRPRPAPYSAQYDDVLAGEEKESARPDAARETVETEPETAQRTGEAEPDAAPGAAEAEPETTPATAEAETAHDTVVAEPATAESTEEPAREAEKAEAPAPKERRVPRAKSRDTGTLRPTREEDVATTAKADTRRSVEREPKAEPGKSRATAFWVAVALAVVFAVAAGIAAWRYFAAASLVENKAQTDPISTSQAQKDINAAVEKLFTYNYRELDEREDEVNELLATDKLRKHFATLNCAVEQQAPKQKIISATKVSYSAITELTDDTARAIVFVENMWERKSTKQVETSSGSLVVNAQLVDNQWKVSDLQIHGGNTGDEPEVPEKCRD